MNTIILNPQVPAGVMTVLNFNRIAEEKIKEAIKAMGMSACQARCLSCSHCSCHCGR